jgi:hypothetical protein
MSITNHSMEDVSKSLGLALTMPLTNPITILVVIVGAIVGPQDYHYLFTILRTIYSQQVEQWII